MVPRTNRAALWAAEQADFIGWVADDNRFRTPGWDEQVLKALQEMGGGVVYGDDAVDPGAKPSHVFMSSAIVRALGWFLHPEMRSTFFDDVWQRIGEGTGRLKYLPGVQVAHLYQEKDNLKDFFHDKEVYERWVRHEMEDDARRALRALRNSSRTPRSLTSRASLTAKA